MLPEMLITQALDLPDAERAELAHRLLESLHHGHAVTADGDRDARFAQEVERRAREVLDGEVELVDGEAVMGRARARLRSR